MTIPLGAYLGAFGAFAAFYALMFFAAGASTVGQAARVAISVAGPNALAGLVTLLIVQRQATRSAARRMSGPMRSLVTLGVATMAMAGWAVWLSVDAWLGGEGFGLRASVAVAQFTFLTSVLLQVAVISAGYAWSASRRAARAEALRARAELAILRSQLNPHFVLNVLHALLGLVRRQPSVAEAALEQLGDLLRFGQQVHESSSEFVAFHQEWTFVGRYADLERLRFGQRLDVEMRADDDLGDHLVPAFVIQPLVENAIVHGIACRRDGGRVAVTARREGEHLVIVVEDDGPGATTDAILASPRLGLRLLRERIDALYCGAARLSFEPGVQGLKARLHLPVESRGEVS